MVRVRLSRYARARAGYLAGMLLIVVGIFLAEGLAAALIVAGINVAVSFLLLYDVEGSQEGEPAPVDSSRRFDPTL